MLCKSLFERVRYELAGCVRAAMLPSIDRKAKAYLDDAGVTPLLTQGDADEIKPVYRDLAYLHRAVRRAKPLTALEFGVGLSTIVLGHAVAANARDGVAGRLYTLDTSAHWLDNTAAKLPDDIGRHVELVHGTARLTTVDGELCHVFDRLPDIVPDFIYLDGPDPKTVEGEVHGLSTSVAHGEPRRAMSADILLYEAGLKIGTMVVVDNRRMNTRFLRRNLKRNWRFRANKAEGRFTFTLRD